MTVRVVTEVPPESVTLRGRVAESGAATIALECAVPHGAGERLVRLHLHPEMILRLAAWLLVEGYTPETGPVRPDGTRLEYRRWHVVGAVERALRTGDHPDLDTAFVPISHHGFVPRALLQLIGDLS